MTAVLVILRREWAAYFRTPVGWVILALFLTLQGLVFWLFVQFLGRPDAPAGGVMEFFFGGTILYWVAVALLATVVPMRLVAEERRTGTIEPLLTAPVGAGQVVLGKWLAAFSFFATAWVPTLFYLCYLRLVGASLDPGPIASGYAGTLLLGAAVLAIGLLASTLTRHQVAAATAAFVAFFVALLMGTLEGQARTPGLAAAFRRVSLFRVMEDFGRGIVDSRHLFLLVTIAVLALLAATAALDRLAGPLPSDAPRRQRIPRLAAPPLILALALMVNVLAGRHPVRGDWTRDRVYDLSDKTVSVLRGLPRPVAVTVFAYPRRESERARAIAALLRELLERALAAGGDRLQVTYVDPDRDPPRAEAAGKRYRIGPFEMGQGVVIVTSGERSKVVTQEDLVEPEVDLAGQPLAALRVWRGEAALVSALLTVTGDDPVRICFSKGHGEPDIASLEDGGYATFADQLRRDGDEVRALDRLGELAAGGCRVLVVAEPTVAFSPAEVAALDAFVAGGGRLLALLGPVFAPDGRAFASVGLVSFAARHGVRLGDNLVVDPEHASDVEGPSVWAASGVSYTAHPIMARLGGRLTYWPRTREVAALEQLPPATTATPLVRSSDTSWGEADLPTIRGEADLVFDSARDRKGPLSVAVAVERSAPQPTRLVFMGTGRLVMNYRLAGIVLRDYDPDLVLSAIGWLSERDARTGVGPKPAGGVALALTERQVDWAFRLFVLLLPLLALGGGALTWMRRRA